jgi:hypothetical protein
LKDGFASVGLFVTLKGMFGTLDVVRVESRIDVTNSGSNHVKEFVSFVEQAHHSNRLPQAATT